MRNIKLKTLKNTKLSVALAWFLQKSKRSDISALFQKQTEGIHPINMEIHALVARLHFKILSGFPSYTAFLSDCIMSLNQYMPVVPSSKASQLVWVYLEREEEADTAQKQPSNAYRKPHTLWKQYSPFRLLLWLHNSILDVYVPYMVWCSCTVIGRAAHSFPAAHL